MIGYNINMQAHITASVFTKFHRFVFQILYQGHRDSVKRSSIIILTQSTLEKTSNALTIHIPCHIPCHFFFF